ncbi:MAG TPA: rubrerythrin family protein [Treponema sp.]|nr:rubrerythrin family protein [Treponema sp.]
MQKKILSPSLRKKILGFQQDEINNEAIYRKLSTRLPNPDNAKILGRIADEEKKHAQRWQEVTGVTLKPSRIRLFLFFFIARFLGLTFAIKKLEKGEGEAQNGYATVLADFPEVKKIIDEETLHENLLIDMIDEERLKYAGSIVLGLNDALVELTGALAGFTFAFQNTRIVAMTGLITGISASFSMASSEYLSQRSEGDGSVSPIKSALYTGLAYILTVVLLVLPFFLTRDFYLALGLTLAMVVVIILGFNYYLCTAKELPLWKHFTEMLIVSLSVTVISFGVGIVVKHFLGVEF